MIQIINDIVARDRVLGDLASEMYQWASEDWEVEDKARGTGKVY